MATYAVVVATVGISGAGYGLYKWWKGAKLKDEKEYYVTAREHGLNNKTLNDYYNSYVYIPDRDITVAKSVLYEIQDHLEKKLRSTQILKGFEFKECVHIGSVFEDLKVIAPNQFDVMVILQPVVEGWVKDGENVDDPAYSIIKINNVSNAAIQNDAVESGILNPDKVREKFHNFIEKAVKGIYSRYKIQISKAGSDISLGVFYGINNEKFVSIDLVPTVKLNEFEILVAKPCPKLKTNLKNRICGLYWRKSYSKEEKNTLESQNTNGCHRKCLKIMKAVRLNHPNNLKMLNSYVYKTILLYMMRDISNWDDSLLDERFIGMLKRLHDCLESRRLPHYFIPDKNLLDEYSDSTLKNTEKWIKRCFYDNKFKDLLMTGYKPEVPDQGRCSIM